MTKYAQPMTPWGELPHEIPDQPLQYGQTAGLNDALTVVLEALGVEPEDVSELRWTPTEIEVRRQRRNTSGSKFVCLGVCGPAKMTSVPPVGQICEVHRVPIGSLAEYVTVYRFRYNKPEVDE